MLALYGVHLVNVSRRIMFLELCLELDHLSPWIPPTSYIKASVTIIVPFVRQVMAFLYGVIY